MKKKDWHDKKIKIVAEGNPRREGTKAHGLWNVLVKYLIEHPGATAGAVIANTDYRTVDLHWDIKHNNIELV